MEPRDAWLLEKLGEMKAQRKAAAFGRQCKRRSKGLNPSRHPELPRRLEFPREATV